VFIVNLGEVTTEDDLLTFALNYGQVDSTRVIRDFTTNQSKGYGFIYMRTIDDACNVSGLYCEHSNTVIAVRHCCHWLFSISYCSITLKVICKGISQNL